IPLANVGHVLQPGCLLPCGVRDESGTLLLSRGHVLVDSKDIEALLERGVYVDELESSKVNSQNEPPKQESMLMLWSVSEARLSAILKTVNAPLFLARLNESIGKILKLPAGNVDLMIFLIMRNDRAQLSNYGVLHSLQTAAICSLLSQRRGWDEKQRTSLIGAALTMNIAMLDLQGSLAAHKKTPTKVERLEIDQHPCVGADLLRAAGLTDPDWLQAVEQHHEVTGGAGYPNKLAVPTEMARMLRFVDTFLAKHSPRLGRAAQPSQKAARDLFTDSGGDPLAGLIIKEFGIYPPGTYVKLANGEVAVVTLRGAAANTPIVMAITNRNGDPLALPSRRDTALSANAKIISTVDESSIRVRHSAESLYDRV
ncbi:MAG: HD domain-containing phosphohydrolase, partial [Betaproteobacteria bacterium]